MAREKHRYGAKTVWWPDEFWVPKEGMYIRTDIPLLDNVSRMIHAQCCIWLNKYKLHADRREDMEDLEMDYKYNIYRELVRRVHKGLYDRNFSLYMNIRSCAWSVFSRTYYTWHRRIKQREQEVPIDAVGPRNEETEGWLNSLSTENASRLVTETDTIERVNALNRQRRSKSHKLYPADKRPVVKYRYTMDNLPDYIENDWMSYLETCYEMGIEARFTKEEFVRQNYGDYVKGPTPVKQLEPTLAEEMHEEERAAADRIRARYAKTSESTSQSST